eukprot:TRINITY_DN975_c0_g1_i1.p1 TRINITY_DN975_c0_g1~~TRINITY_DN975_c0_g1_i1.p1  ORF type:complete len:252 (+),score=66.91 TRINITY_DN975_c0_g1_i1:169-924(+)
MDNLPEHLQIPNDTLELINEIGRGAYGVVWKAVWHGVGSGDTVCVKKFNIVNPKMMESLCSEVQFLSQTSHTNIIRLFGMSEDSIVMELIDGGSLYDLLHNENIELDWNRKLHLAKQACQAINFLHNRKNPILHRDLKSLNLLVNKDNVLKLIDFGMSKVKHASQISTQTAKALVGSVRWMAGETTAKVPQWTTKTDIFALGMVLYEIASRKIPFEDVQEDQQVIILIKYEKERPDLPSDTPPFFAEIISK